MVDYDLLVLRIDKHTQLVLDIINALKKKESYYTQYFDKQIRIDSVKLPDLDTDDHKDILYYKFLYTYVD